MNKKRPVRETQKKESESHPSPDAEHHIHLCCPNGPITGSVGARRGIKLRTNHATPKWWMALCAQLRSNTLPTSTDGCKNGRFERQPPGTDVWVALVLKAVACFCWCKFIKVLRSTIRGLVAENTGLHFCPCVFTDSKRPVDNCRPIRGRVGGQLAVCSSVFGGPLVSNTQTAHRFPNCFFYLFMYTSFILPNP